MDSYKDMAERMKDMDENDSNSVPGDSTENRATMVPTGSFPTLQVSFIQNNIMI